MSDDVVEYPASLVALKAAEGEAWDSFYSANRQRRGLPENTSADEKISVDIAEVNAETGWLAAKAAYQAALSEYLKVMK